ncbi:hypothetical protein HHK36_011372 [Tetracentron sinense]|uniref:Poly [ADP-ribose] polymerase n=1 Tax=Tetracentron sinense TaxID=13715 RepID=A0A834ZBR2_TETSI|nr:hypothetical protein HHK36_011372 [Tetracentron sinense]
MKVSEDEKVGTMKNKAETKGHEMEQKQKKAKTENSDNGQENRKTTAEVAAEFVEFCKVTRQYLSIEQMREILEANGQNYSGSDDAVVPRCQDMLFYGALHKCPVCNCYLECTGSRYSCTGPYSEWSACTFSMRDLPRREDPIKLPDWITNTAVSDLLKNHQDPSSHPHRELDPENKPFSGITTCQVSRLSRTHNSWKREIEKYGGKVANTVPGVTSCLVVSPAERKQGGSSKVVEAMERGIPVVRESWLRDSIEKQAAQSLEAYDVETDLSMYGKGISWDKQDFSDEALKSFSAEFKLYGKRGVHKDSRLQEQGGKICEKNRILFNCAFSIFDQGKGLNEYCIMQLIMVPENHLYVYYKKGSDGDDSRAEERLEEWDDIDNAVKEFARIFEELTGNEFDPWEREKKFQKKCSKFYPIDMVQCVIPLLATSFQALLELTAELDDGVDVRYGGLGLWQLGIAVARCKLDPLVANFMKILCSQDIYKFAMMEMGLDSPDLPTGMLSKVHFGKCEEVLQHFTEILKSMKETGQKAEAIWSDFSQRWFTLMHSSRPFIFSDYHELADHAAAALETVRDINVASHLIGDLTGSTIDDPLFDRYTKLGCSILPVEKESEDYKMIPNYLEQTYETVKVEDITYGISVNNIFAVDSSACLSYEEIKKLPNKVLLWCATRSSNLLKHLHEGFFPAICSLPVPGYMFGKAIVCSDTAAKAAQYGFTAVDRPEGFLVLAVASLGDQITEFKTPPESLKTRNRMKGLGKKNPDESEHTVWKDDIKVPCGRLIPSRLEDSLLEYNEYAVYDPKQVSISFLVGVRIEEKGVVMDTEE